MIAELVQASQPGIIWPSASGSGAEDCIVGAPTAAKGLARVTNPSLRMSAVELLVTSQAFEPRDPETEVSTAVRKLVSQIQTNSARKNQDQPLSDDIEEIYEAVVRGHLIPPMRFAFD